MNDGGKFGLGRRRLERVALLRVMSINSLPTRTFSRIMFDIVTKSDADRIIFANRLMERDAMATRSTVRSVCVAIITAGLIAGCANQSSQTRQERVDRFCQQQGSEMGIWQCQQYYAREIQTDPQTATNQVSQSGVDPHDRAMLLSIMLSRPQPQPYVLPMPVYTSAPPPRSFSCYKSANMISCN